FECNRMRGRMPDGADVLRRLGTPRPLGAATSQVLDLGRPDVDCDLKLHLAVHEDGALGELRYDAELFERETVERMAAHFVGILRSVVANATVPISALDLLPSSERTKLIVEWNGGEQEYARDVRIEALVSAEAE